MKPFIHMNELKMSRLEKIASDIRMMDESLDVEITHNADSGKTRIVVRQEPNGMMGFLMSKIIKYCDRRGYYGYNVFAFIVDSKIDLTFEIS